MYFSSSTLCWHLASIFGHGFNWLHQKLHRRPYQLLLPHFLIMCCPPLILLSTPIDEIVYTVLNSSMAFSINILNVWDSWLALFKWFLYRRNFYVIFSIFLVLSLPIYGISMDTKHCQSRIIISHRRPVHCGWPSMVSCFVTGELFSIHAGVRRLESETLRNSLAVVARMACTCFISPLTVLMLSSDL